MRNLDLTALRSFVTIAEMGGVTRAAGVLNLTQSAVSMQLKRLEDMLGLKLFDRTSRSIVVTSAGEHLLQYAKKMLELNDEVYTKLTAEDFEGEIRLGAPHDIIYPRVPQILRDVAAAFPRVKVRLISAPSMKLKEMFKRGEVDLILTTETAPDTGGESLITLPLLWVGAIGGTAWKKSPLPVALCANCSFRPITFKVLENAGTDWTMEVDSQLDNAIEAAVSADLAATVLVQGNLPPQTEAIPHGGALPPLGETQIILYMQRPNASLDAAVAEIVRRAHRPSNVTPLPKTLTA